MSFLPHADTGMCVLYILLHILSSSPWCAAHTCHAIATYQSPIGACSAAAPQTQSGAHLQETSHSLLPSAWKGWILGDTEGFSQVQVQDRGEKELQFRKPYGACKTLSSICKKATRRFEILLEAFSSSPGTLHWNSGFAFITTYKGCGALSLHRDGEGATKWEPAAAKWFLRRTTAEKAALRITPTPINPAGLHTALTVSGNTPRVWRMTTETTHLHSLTMTTLNFPSVCSPTGLWPKPPAPPALQCPLICLTSPLFLYSSAKHLPFLSTFFLPSCCSL